MNYKNVRLSRRRLARLRFFQNCVDCFENCKELPTCLCYIPLEVAIRCQRNAVIPVFAEPNKNSSRLLEIVCTSETKLVISGEEYYTSAGKWARIKQYERYPQVGLVTFTEDAWILLSSSVKSGSDTSPLLTIVTPVEEHVGSDEQHSSKKYRAKQHKISSYEKLVEYTYSLHMGQDLEVAACDEEAVQRSRRLPTNWTLEHDEALVRFLTDQIPPNNSNLGSIKDLVEHIEVSSEDGDGPERLTDDSPDLYWESDGSQGQHWIRLHMKKGVIVKKLYLTIDGSDANYIPSKIVVQGGPPDNMKRLNTVNIDGDVVGRTDVCVLEEMTEFYPVIIVRIKECKSDGIDTRIHGIKIKSANDVTLPKFSVDTFQGPELVRFPLLEPYSPDELLRRSLLLYRFMAIVDSILPYMVPAWHYTMGAYTGLQTVRQILPLSQKRLTLIELILKESSTEAPADIPKLYINRRAAADHRDDPTHDPEYKQSVFAQIYNVLRTYGRDRYTQPLDYRWSSRHEQWWECKFLSEGIIDQGGGFRDSLSDLAEELCPSSIDSQVPLPFFVRAPNQSQEDSNVNQDMYTPNPSCQELAKYKWIGQIMGACLRCKDNLVLCLPPFFWKHLSGEQVTWTRDYSTVDAAEVRLIDSLQGMDEETFNACVQGRTWSCLLSDGTEKQLRTDDDDTCPEVQFTERQEYCEAVRQDRMAEAEKQIAAIKQGLLTVLPQAVLELLTWQELERRICGDSEISLEALRKYVQYDDVYEEDTCVKYLWEALKNFSNEDRSRFLRFVTGRRRLPAAFIVCSGMEEWDILPESSTCGNIIYLPKYSSAKVLEEKLRYAIYNCIAIDTDMSPWDDG